MKVGVVTTFAGRDPEKSVEDNIDIFKEVFTPFVRKAEELDVKIAIENCPMMHGFPFRGVNIAYSPHAWDLMFEAGAVLWTWSLPAPPDRGEALPASARHLVAHRIAYLEYEGEVSGGRGSVAVHDRGVYEWVGEAPPESPDLADLLTFELRGERTCGRFELRPTPADGKDLWRLRKLG